MSDISDLKKMAREAELEVLEYPDGRVLVIGGDVNVHWWPQSRRRTAYVEGASQGTSHATAKKVIALATQVTK